MFKRECESQEDLKWVTSYTKKSLNCIVYLNNAPEMSMDNLLDALITVINNNLCKKLVLCIFHEAYGESNVCCTINVHQRQVGKIPPQKINA